MAGIRTHNGTSKIFKKCLLENVKRSFGRQRLVKLRSGLQWIRRRKFLSTFISPRVPYKRGISWPPEKLQTFWRRLRETEFLDSKKNLTNPSKSVHMARTMLQCNRSAWCETSSIFHGASIFAPRILILHNQPSFVTRLEIPLLATSLRCTFLLQGHWRQTQWVLGHL